jgi:hypothetical protein
VYQVGVTRDCVIRMDTVFKLGAEQLLTAPSSECPAVEHAIRNLLDFRQSDFTNLYIISRRDLTPDRKEATVRRVTLKCGTAHFLVDYDNPDQRITLHSAHNTGWDAAEWHRPYDSFPSSDFPGVVGMATGSTDINVLGRYVLDGESGAVLESHRAEDPGQDLTWLLAASAIPCSYVASAALSVVPKQPPFPRSMMRTSASKCTDKQLEVVEGEIPADLQGHLYLIAPVGSVSSDGLPNSDNSHVWNGNGLIHRFDLNQNSGTIRLTTRSWLMALCLLALACTLVPSNATSPMFTIPTFRQICRI